MLTIQQHVHTALAFYNITVPKYKPIIRIFFFLFLFYFRIILNIYLGMVDFCFKTDFSVLFFNIVSGIYKELLLYYRTKINIAHCYADGKKTVLERYI